MYFYESVPGYENLRRAHRHLHRRRLPRERVSLRRRRAVTVSGPDVVVVDEDVEHAAAAWMRQRSARRSGATLNVTEYHAVCHTWQTLWPWPSRFCSLILPVLVQLRPRYDTLTCP